MSSGTMQRREVVSALLAPRQDNLLTVGGLGSSSWDIAATADNPQDFCLVGGMGLTVSVGLGLAGARPQNRVLVITGDGDMLMGMGSLATVAQIQPRNLAIVVLDNEMFGETGGQPTHTAGVTDLAAIAKGAGIPTTGTIRDAAALQDALPHIHESDGPVFYIAKVSAEMPPTVYPPLDGPFAKDRFRAAVLGDGAV
jgi:thiamine pyrophosphate-dependent acetolactate synthase large subunit-like protein